MRELAFILYEKASRGDLAAMKLIFHYVMGKPPETVDPDQLDIDEWQKMQEQSRPPQEMGEVINGVPARLACDLTNITWPCKLETAFTGPLRDGLRAMDERDAKKAAAPKGNGENGAAAPIGNGEIGPAAPIPNGENGSAENWGVMPIPNVANGPEEDWLLRWA